MNTNDYNGEFEQAPNYQNNGYQQMPNYQNNGYQQMPNYQNNGYQQIPNYQYGMNEQQPQKAPNIFKQFAFAFVPPKYKELARAKTGSMIWLIILLVFFITGIGYLLIMADYIFNSGIGETLDSMPYFELENGELFIDDELCVEEGSTIIYVTDEIREFGYDDVEELQERGFVDIMLLGRYNMCLYTDREYKEMQYYELGDISITKDDVENWAGPYVWIIMFVVYAIWFVLRVVWYFLSAAIYLLIGMLLALIYGKQIGSGHIYRAAVYAKIPMFIFVSLWNALPLGLTFPGILKVIVTLVFLGLGVWFLPEKKPEYQYQQY